MFGLIGRMSMVTRLATSSFGIFIDMQEVEIPVAVAKISQLTGFGIESHGLVVTLEAHCIILGFVRHIEALGKELLQNASILTAMRVVTSIAVSLLNGAVKILLLGNILTHIRMTGET